jgi:4-amino-4-deoxy-L-arabinose transferase-like glycosyltransferase
MAAGEGSFWQPIYAGPYPFWSHPPLMFGLQAIFFKIFGPFFGTEKIYNFVVWLATLLLIRAFWKSIDISDRFRSLWWLPVLFWGFMPSVLWAYPNNILDGTVAVFSIAAVLVLYRAMGKDKRYLHTLVAAMLIFCASLTKGLSGLFPLAAPILYVVIYRNGKLVHALLHTLVMVAVIAAIYALLWQFPQPHQYLESYLNSQVMGSLSGRNDITESGLGRFEIIAMLLTEVAIIAGIALLLFVLSKVLKTGRAELPNRSRHVLFFILIGLSASLPFMVSFKVRSFYLVPALPYFAIAGAVLVYPLIAPLTERYTLSRKYTKGLSAAFALAAIVAIFLMYSKAGTIGRDHEMIEDVNTISQHVPEKEKIIAAPGLNTNYEFMAYMQRYKKIDSYYPLELNNARYIIADAQANKPCYLWRADLNGYRKMPINTRRFVVYEKEL